MEEKKIAIEILLYVLGELNDRDLMNGLISIASFNEIGIEQIIKEVENE